MIQRSFLTGLILTLVAFGAESSDVLRFEIADVHSSAKILNTDPDISGGLMRGGIYRLHRATMVDLIRIAWDVKADKVFGGPSWLEMDKFDILAKASADVTPASVKLMLRTLLQERFDLKARTDMKPLPAFVLSAGKRNGLKKSDDSGEPGCKAEQAKSDGPIPTESVICHRMTMERFVSEISNLPGSFNYVGDHRIENRADLPGEWDFTFTYSLRSRVTTGGAEVVTLADALDKQLGLKLEPADLPTQVVVVESVNEKPAPNPPGTEKLLPETVSEFEVADIKPTDPDYRGGEFRILPGGRITARGIPLKDLIEDLWGLSDELLIGAPKSAESDRWDFVAKAPPAAAILDAGTAQDADFPVDADMLDEMARNLLKERFKLSFHMEERPLSAYTLSALKPRMKKADPAERTKCEEGPAQIGKPDARDANPILGRLLTCRNTTMARFAELLPELANGYVHSPVLDNTGLPDGYDFTLSFSTIGQLRGGDGQGGDASKRDSTASDPNGAISLPDAMEKQLGIKMELAKRPVRVMVIDRLEAKPTDN